MKNITPEWEVVHMERIDHPTRRGNMYTPAAVYLMHKGHAVSIEGTHVWRIEEEKSREGYICAHCLEEIPEEMLERWLKMRRFLMPNT